jgi:hypothetical protein
MREKKRKRIEEGAARYFDPGETMRAAVHGYEGSRWVVLLYPFALVGGLIAATVTKHRLVILTDRNVYILQGGFWSIAKPRGVVEKHPVGAVQIRADAGFPAGHLFIGSTKLWVARANWKDAVELAAAATDAP